MKPARPQLEIRIASRDPTIQQMLRKPGKMKERRKEREKEGKQQTKKRRNEETKEDRKKGQHGRKEDRKKERKAERLEGRKAERQMDGWKKVREDRRKEEGGVEEENERKKQKKQQGNAETRSPGVEKARIMGTGRASKRQQDAKLRKTVPCMQCGKACHHTAL